MEKPNIKDYDNNDIFWKDFMNLKDSPYVLDFPLTDFKCQLVFLVKKSDFSKKDYPLALGYLASLVRMNKGKVKINIQDSEEYNPKDFEGFNLICFYPMVALFNEVIGLAKKIKQDNPESKICFLNSDQHQHEMILCTPSAADFGENMMKRHIFIDYILIGEAEKSFIELCNKISKKTGDFLDIPACFYRERGKISLSKKPIEPVNFNFLPFASRDYLERGISENGINSLSPRIQSKRGCMSPCYYCAESCSNITIGGRKMPILQRDVIRFVDEIELLQKNYGVVFFNVIDSSFEDPGKIGLERMDEFCNEIINRKINASFKIHLRVETAYKLDDNFFLKIKEAGVDVIGIGVESGIKKELDAYRKITTVEQNMKTVSRIEKIGKFFLVLGHMMFSPVLGLEDLPEKIEFIKKINHGWDYTEMSNNVLIYPGTKLHSSIKEKGLELPHDELAPIIPYKFQDEKINLVADEMTKLRTRCHEAPKLNNLLYDSLNIISRFRNKINCHLWIREKEFEEFKDSIHRIMKEAQEIYTDYLTELVNLARKGWDNEKTDAIYKKVISTKIEKLCNNVRKLIDDLFNYFESSELSTEKLYLKTWMSLINSEINTSGGKIGEIWDTEIRIVNKKIKNRIVYPPLSCNWADIDGNPNDKIFNYYKRLAEGGCGMIVLEGTAVYPDGKGATNTICLYKEDQIEKFLRITDIIKKNNVFCSIQLMHVGGQGNPNFTGTDPYAPSFYECRGTGFSAREMSLDEIRDIKNKFVNSAVLAEKIGFDAIELHLAHGYLLHEFLSEYFNKRTDEYGGCLENRMRLILEIIEGIKNKTHLIIGVRISGEDYLENGINFKINKEILPVLEKAGIEYFSITAGVYDTSKIKHERMKIGEFFEYSKKIKSIVTKPVICVGKIKDIETAEMHLKKRDCDLVAIGRAQLADPSLVNKHLKRIPYRKCIECGDCSYLRLGRKDVKCRVREE